MMYLWSTALYAAARCRRDGDAREGNGFHIGLRLGGFTNPLLKTGAELREQSEI